VLADVTEETGKLSFERERNGVPSFRPARLRVSVGGAAAISALAVAGVLSIPLRVPAVAEPEQGAVLERYPVCEASAALEVACAGVAGERCVLVADNEWKKDVFRYALDAAGRLTPVPGEGWKVGLGDAKLEDAEAFALAGEGVLVVGSHGRKSSCERDEARFRVVRLRPVGAGPASASFAARADVAQWEAQLAGCAEKLVRLSGAAAAADALALRAAFCAAVAETEEAARELQAYGEKCPGDAFNIEGATTLPAAPPDAAPGSPAASARTWVGLRAPLVGGRAALLRVAPLDGAPAPLAFDGIALVDLGGRGIRELTFAGGWVWGVAGATRDTDEPSRLWRVRAADVQNGATIVAEILGEALPSTAEGLVVRADALQAIVITDGDTDKDDQRCAENGEARQLVVSIPRT
jgi:hypothetical protein